MFAQKHLVKSHLRTHLSFYLFVSIVFVIGIVFGTVMVGALTLDMNQEISRHLGNFFSKVEQGLFVPSEHTFWSLFASNAKWLLLIWLFGLSVIGLPLILVMDFLKGALIGFTITFLASEYEFQGVLFALTAVVPQNLIIVPVLFISSVTAMAFAVYLVRNRFLRHMGSLYQPFMRYCLVAILLLLLLAAISLYEVWLSPQLMRTVTPALLSLFGFPVETV